MSETKGWDATIRTENERKEMQHKPQPLAIVSRAALQTLFAAYCKPLPPPDDNDFNVRWAPAREVNINDVVLAWGDVRAAIARAEGRAR